MSGQVFGTVKAAVKGPDQKTKYITVGRAIRDTENGRISLAIDALPRDMANWTGWLNIFEDVPPPHGLPSSNTRGQFDDDIPF